jgi:hypothetical protein
MPEDTFIRITHPDFPGSLHMCTEEAWEDIWSVMGWVLAGDDVIAPNIRPYHLSSVEKNKPNGVAALDNNGMLDPDVIPGFAPNVFNSRSYGATGNGVIDDAPALQALFDDAATPGTGVPVGTVDISPGIYRLTSTLVIDEQALIIDGKGVGNTANYATPGNGVSFIWDGPAGQPMMRIINSAWCEIRNILFLPGDSSPSEGIYLEAPVTGTSGTNTRIKLSRCKFGRMAWGSNEGTFDYCVRVGGAANTNNDEFEFDSCHFEWADVACVSIDNTQSVWGFISNCFFGRGAVGLKTNADVKVVNGTFNRNSCDIEVGSSNLVTIDGFWSENALQHIRLTTTGGKVHVRDGKLLFGTEWVNGGALPSIDHQQCGTSAMVVLDGLWFSNATGTAHSVKIRGNNSSTTGTLDVKQCVGLSLSHLDVAGVSSPGTAGVVVQFISRSERRYERVTGSNTLDTTLANQLNYPDTDVSMDTLKLKAYTNATRPAAATAGAGTVIYNTDTPGLQVSNGTTWIAV